MKSSTYPAFPRDVPSEVVEALCTDGHWLMGRNQEKIRDSLLKNQCLAVDNQKTFVIDPRFFDLTDNIWDQKRSKALQCLVHFLKPRPLSEWKMQVSRVYGLSSNPSAVQFVTDFWKNKPPGKTVIGVQDNNGNSMVKVDDVSKIASLDPDAKAVLTEGFDGVARRADLEAIVGSAKVQELEKVCKVTQHGWVYDPKYVADNWLDKSRLGRFNIPVQGTIVALRDIGIAMAIDNLADVHAVCEAAIGEKGDYFLTSNYLVLQEPNQNLATELTGQVEKEIADLEKFIESAERGVQEFQTVVSERAKVVAAAQNDQARLIDVGKAVLKQRKFLQNLLRR